VKVARPTSVERTRGRLRLCTIADISSISFDHSSNDVAFLILTLSGVQKEDTHLEKHIPVISGKKGQSDFSNRVLPASIAFIREHLYKGRDICVTCETGTDLSVGVVLAALQLFFEDDGTLRQTSQVNKATTSSSMVLCRTTQLTLPFYS